MIPKYLSAILAATAPAIGNHLWQSTVCIVIAGLLTLVLRKNHARARYGLWLAASVKFLIPFSLLVTLGMHLARPRVLPATESGFFFAMQEVSQPFTPPATGSQAAGKSRRPAQGAGLRYRLVHNLPAILVAMWFCGFLVVLFVWYARWRRISAALREAVPLREGREVEALRRLERLGGIRKPIELLLSPATLEPGIFGIVKPVLGWPKGFSEHLPDAHLEAILAHEMWHVRRRDNLAAAMHMVVEAIFWFHPLVWWLGSRLVEERERACDEEVVELGSERQVYAESILKTCEFCLESPLACVSGVTGADLKKRIVRIMSERMASKLSFGKKLLLAAIAIAAVAGPVVFGLVNAPQIHAQSTPPKNAPLPSFEVASIKRNPSVWNEPTHHRMDVHPELGGRLTAHNAPLMLLIQRAYAVQAFQVVGGPAWINTDGYDVEAKPEGNTDRKEMWLMLQTLLADRFKLTLHRETRRLPVYDLKAAKRGPKLPAPKAVGCVSRPPDAPPTPSPQGQADCGYVAGPMGPSGLLQLEGSKVHMADLISKLALVLGRPVLDKTEFTGEFDLNLSFTADEATMGLPGFGGPGDPGGSPLPTDPNVPNIFAALEEQLGLKLVSAKGPVEVLVIDHVERPSEN
jgi:uncharacterized protein (TIGR03435 family)